MRDDEEIPGNSVDKRVIAKGIAIGIPAIGGGIAFLIALAIIACVAVFCFGFTLFCAFEAITAF